MTNVKKQKVYHGVIHELQVYIETNRLLPGDKLPSERELAESLCTGRSSIREAFRALELLGVIETRHGEGTFLSTYQTFQTVDLLASFILKDKQVHKDIFQTKKLLEKEVIKCSFSNITLTHVNELNKIIEKKISANQKHREFFTYLFNRTSNQLLFRIWSLLQNFSSQTSENPLSVSFYHKLLEALQAKDEQAVDSLFNEQTET